MTKLLKNLPLLNEVKVGEGSISRVMDGQKNIINREVYVAIFQQAISQKVWNERHRNGDETPEEFYRRQAKALAKSEKVSLSEDSLFSILSSHLICLGGRSQFALGTNYKKQTLSNCFTVKIAKDSMQAIMQAQSEFAFTMQAGGGVGCNFSILRPKSAIINSTQTTSSGVLSFMDGFDAYCATINAGGNRRGAMIGLLEVWHPEILDFIRIKQTKGRLSNFNLSVVITDKFMQAVANNEVWNLEFPDTTHPKYDTEWNGDLDSWITKGYPTVIYKTLPARDVFEELTYCSYMSGEPGVIFVDTINKMNNLFYCENIRECNPCGEIAMAPYNSCNLGAINLTKIVDEPFNADINPMDNIQWDFLRTLVDYGVHILNAIIDVNYYPLKQYEVETLSKRPIGLGVLGFGSMLNLLNVGYNTETARLIANKIGQVIANQAYQTSAKLAKKYGTFPMYKEAILSSNFIQQLDDETKELIAQYGLYNCRLLTIAPTGSTALLANNVSGGLEPLFATEYIRNLRNPDGSFSEQKIMDYSVYYYRMKHPNKPLPEHFNATATNITVKDHLLMQAVWQKWIDHSISKTTNIAVDYPFEDFKNIYIEAWKSGLKGLTVYRPNDITGSILKDATQQDKNQSVDNTNTAQYDIVRDDLYKIELESSEPAIRNIVYWKNKSKVYIIITITEDGYPLEIFTKLPKDAGNGTHQFEREQFFEYVSNWDAICRTASTLLRYGVPVSEIIKQLDRSSYSMFDCSALLARILKQYPLNVTFTIHDKNDNTEDIDIENVDTKETNSSIDNGVQKCPACGADALVMQQGCSTCMQCGYSKCE